MGKPSVKRYKKETGVDDGFEGAHDKVIPDHLFSSIPHHGVPADPQQIYSTPSTTQQVTDVSIIRIDLPNFGIYDMREAMLEFDADLSFTPNGTFETSHIETFVPFDSNAGAALAALQGNFHISLNGRVSRPIGFNASIATIQSRIDELAASTNDTQTYVVSGSGMNNVAGITITTTNFTESPNTSGKKPAITNENLSTGVVALDIESTIDLVGAVSQRSRVAFHSWIGSVFREMLIRIGGVEVQEQKNYNLLQNILWSATKFSEFETGYGNMLYGVGTFDQRVTWSTGRRYAIPLMASLFGTKSLPLAFTPGTMQIELHTETPTFCTEFTGAAPSNVSYTLKNFRWMYDVFRLPKAVHDMIEMKVEHGESALFFNEYEHYIDTITSARHTINITERAQSISEVIIVLREDQASTAAETLDRFLLWQDFDLSNFQIKIGDVYIPAQQTRRFSATNNTELYWNYQKALGNFSSTMGTLKDAGITNRYETDKFLIWFNFDPHKHEDLIGGKNTSKNSTPINLELTFGAAPANNLRADVFVNTARVLGYKHRGAPKLIR